MHEQENIALVRRGWRAVIDRDYETLRPLLAEDTVWSSPYQPALHGADEVIASMRQWGQRGVTVEGEAGNEGIFASDDRVVSVEHVTMTHDGRTMDTHTAHVYQVRNGKLASLTEYTPEPQKVAEFLS